MILYSAGNVYRNQKQFPALERSDYIENDMNESKRLGYRLCYRYGPSKIKEKYDWEAEEI